MPTVDLVVANARIATLAGPARPRAGREMSELALVDGAVAVDAGRIVSVGPAPKGRLEIDAGGALVTPGLVDAHTHAVFAGIRADEFERRLQGASYMEIAKAGGGILSTVDRTRAATRDELAAAARRRLDAALRLGVTTVEVKSGYGLSTAEELKILDAIAQLASGPAPRVVATFLGAHEVPRELAGRRGEYVDLVEREMIPAAAGRARFCDVFCERGVFTPEESRRILVAARKAGMLLKLHADEFAPSGAAELAAELGAVSADHLMAVTDEGIARLKGAGTIAVLLPATSFFLGGARYAPARKIVEAGVPVALGTDCNPGSSMTWNLPLVISMACAQLRLTAAEALVAATTNAAWAVGAGTETGTLEPGKAADFVLWDARDAREIPYHLGASLARTVIGGGRVVESR